MCAKADNLAHSVHYQGKDRRVQRTQKRLGEALFSLLHEKSYDAIAVKEILHRADVGRSTFYSHYRDKDELLLSEMGAILRSAHSEPCPDEAPHESVVRWSLPLFEHISRHRKAARPEVESHGQPAVHSHLEEMLAQLIALEVGRWFQRRNQPMDRPPPDLVARQVAATFILVLDWTGNPPEGRLSAGETNQLFRSLVLPTLAAAV